MKKIYTALILLLFIIQYSHAKVTQYPVSAIPQQLLIGANAVIRMDSTILEISKTGFTSIRKTAITILNENGNSFAVFRQHYDVFSKIYDISAKLYDGEGVLIKSVSGKDLIDRSTFGSSYTFNDDSRIKLHDFEHKQYPYTVVFEYTIKYKTNFFLPSWDLQPDEKVAVEKASITVNYPKEVNFKFKGYKLPAHVRKEEKQEVYTESIIESKMQCKWIVNDIPAFTYQPYSSPDGNYLPTIRFATGNVSLNDYKGQTDTWEQFGKFIYNINQDKDSLPPAVVEKLHVLTDSITEIKGKIAALYRYLQQNTRYVANEYGLSGWQTFDAVSLAKSGYGDCKGLSNYMKSMLKAIGIPSNLVIISAGSNNTQSVDIEFPFNIFNHMILCVPMTNDTMWLECTSGTLPAGYLGSFTQDRYALVLTKDGGRMVKTPSYNRDRNFIERNISIELDAGQDMQHVVWESVYSGLKQDDLAHYLLTTPASKTGERVRLVLPYPNVEMVTDTYTFSNVDPLCPRISEKLELKVGNLINETGKRLLISIPMMKNPMTSLLSTGTRTEPIVLKEDFKHIYHYKINLPQGMKLEALPSTVQLKFPFAEYHCEARQDGTLLTVEIAFEQHKGIYATDQYRNYEGMFRKIEQSSGELTISLIK
ncbi:Transglutaminase-like superfamily protein [compost metagenome]